MRRGTPIALIPALIAIPAALGLAAESRGARIVSTLDQEGLFSSQLSAAKTASGADPTFTKDVLPIIQKNCQICHRSQGLNLGGMMAPMELKTYEDVKRYAPKIEWAVKSGYMPPWHAARDHLGTFKNERVLTDAQIDTILAWIKNGTAEGDPADAPPPVTFLSDTSGWAIGEPDLIVRFTEPYLVRDEVEDEYVDIEVPITEEMLPEDRWIKAVEFRPGSRVVHHIIARPIGGIAPGYEPTIYEDGYSRLLRKGTTVNFQMHYHKESGPGTAIWDQTEAAIVFYEPGEKIEHVIETESLGMFDFVIPAGDPDYSYGIEYTMDKDVDVLWFNPHMHLRGKAAKYVATFPDGRQEVLLHVPHYDFNWQHTYRLKEPVFLPKGTKIDLTLWWDNSADNPSNPDPNREVRWGRPTTDEMGFGWMTVVDVEPRSIIADEPIPGDLPAPRPIARPREERLEGPGDTRKPLPPRERRRTRATAAARSGEQRAAARSANEGAAAGRANETAAAPATQADVTGKWVLSVELGAGGGDATFELVQDGDKITGTYSGALGSQEVAGTIKGDEIEFSFDSQAGKVTYKGTVSDNTMEGTCDYGQLGPGTFTGEKVE